MAADAVRQSYTTWQRFSSFSELNDMASKVYKKEHGHLAKNIPKVSPWHSVLFNAEAAAAKAQQDCH